MSSRCVPLSSILLGLLLATTANAMKADPCPPDRYLIDLSGVPELAALGESPVALDVAADGTVTLGACGAASGKVKGRTRATKVRAKWRECGALRKVKLKATIASPACTTVEAKIKAKKVKKQTTSAAPSRCGDGWVDDGAGEACDDSAIDGDAACPAGCLPPEDAAACACDPLVAQTEAGAVRGVSRDGARSFYAIPYAAPPVGDLRWKAPEPPIAWEGVRDAGVPGAVCPQVVPVVDAPIGAEDCLLANVHTPEVPPEAPLPVMVWIHGGGFTVGDGLSFGGTDGSLMASRGDVVVVSFNYRLGQFGFLAHPLLTTESDPQPTSGNYGIRDQIAALEWVRDNVAAFWGDPTNVTIFGESAGGISVCALLASSMAGGLFHQAIVQSGPCGGPFQPLAESEAQGEVFEDRLGCAGAPDVLGCMRGKSMEEVRAALAPTDLLGLFDVAETVFYFPTIDGVVLEQQMRDSFASGDFNQVPTMIGSNRDEGTLFSVFSHDAKGMPLTEELYPDRLLVFLEDQTLVDQVVAEYPVQAFASPTDAFSAAFGDGFLACPTIETATLLSSHVPTSFYQFEFPDAAFQLPSPLPLGAFHSAEIQYVFGRPPAGAFTPGEQALASVILGYWTRFARTGDPNGAGALEWPLFTASDQHLVLDTVLDVGTGAKADACAFWATLDASLP